LVRTKAAEIVTIFTELKIYENVFVAGHPLGSLERSPDSLAEGFGEKGGKGVRGKG